MVEIMKRIKRVVAMIAALLTIFCMVSGVTVAYAADEDATEAGRGQQMIDAGGGEITKFIAKCIAQVIDGVDAVDKDSATGVLNEAIMSSDSGLRKIWEGVINDGSLKGFYDVIFSLGASLTIAYFLIYLMREITESRFNPDALVKACIMLVAALYLMANGFDLLTKLVDIGTALGNSLLVAENPETYLTIKDSWIAEVAANKNVIVRGIALCMACLSYIPAFVKRAPMLYIQVICYMRLLELFCRIIFAPLAIGDIYSGGQNPTAVRYLRSFLACVLSGVVIVGANLCYRSILSAGLPEMDTVSGFFAHIVILFALMGFCGKANTFAKELCGVG